jgi:hypothetical protein
VLDDKIPTSIPEKGYEGFAALRGNTVADEKAGAISLTGRATDNLAVHFESSMRDADDYQAADWDEPQVDGTFAENNNTSFGASWIGERGYFGRVFLATARSISNVIRTAWICIVEATITTRITTMITIMKNMRFLLLI